MMVGFCQNMMIIQLMTFTYGEYYDYLIIFFKLLAFPSEGIANHFDCQYTPLEGEMPKIYYKFMILAFAPLIKFLIIFGIILLGCCCIRKIGRKIWTTLACIWLLELF